MPNENDLMGINGMNNMNDPGMHPYGAIPDGSVPDAGANMTDEQAKRLANGGGRDGRMMAGSGPGSNRASFEQGYGGGIASSMPPGMNPSLSYSMHHGQNGHSYSQGYDIAGNGTTMQSQPVAGLSHLPNVRPSMPIYTTNSAGQQQPGSDYMFHQNPQPGYMAPYNSAASESQVSIKHEPPMNSSANAAFPGSYAQSPSDLIAGSSNSKWNIQDDDYHELSARLIFYCFPRPNQITSRNSDIRSFLSADNLKHFLNLFSAFQIHFPFIHMPTFRIANIYDGLLLSLICIGAAYSDRLNQSQVRDMMDVAKNVIERNAQIYSTVSRDQNGVSGYGNGNSVGGKAELEEICAVFTMQILFTWHGTPNQREKARQQFPFIIQLARRAGLTQPTTTLPYSALHQPNVAVEHFNAASFNWITWVEQEKRSRLMYLIFLMDASMPIYFNTAPLLEMFEITLPLPADDAAWEARNATECAEALGLHGDAAARTRNPSGSRRPKQPEMNSALGVLMHNDTINLKPLTTNLYSKFILVHALHVQLWIAQRQTRESNQINHQMAFASRGTLSQNDWVLRGTDPTGSGAPSSNNSGRGTPVENSALNSLTHLMSTFEKWKKAWDEDMAVQYPPSSTAIRSLGFCRDALHFYWLTKLPTKTQLDWQMAPDQHLQYVLHMLKQVQAYVVSDSAIRGEELGSVNDIDKNYGVKDLTLDMTQFFKLVGSQDNSPTMNVHMNVGNGMV
jgi:hypothetical protein